MKVRRINIRSAASIYGAMPENDISVTSHS